MKKLALLTALAVSLIPPASAEILNLEAPGIAPNVPTSDHGDAHRSVIFNALANFSIISAGIFIDPLSEAAPPNSPPYTLRVTIYAVTANGNQNGIGDRGAQLATATNVFNSDNDWAFYDIPIAFNFIAGSRYEVAFNSVVPSGWGTLSENDYLVQYQHYDPSLPGYAPFTVGGVLQVLDGGDGTTALGNYRNDNFPTTRLATGIPEPSTFSVLGLGLFGLGLLKLRGK